MVPVVDGVDRRFSPTVVLTVCPTVNDAQVDGVAVPVAVGVRV
jgi:hypothetical protein